MADRTSARLFGSIFEHLANDPTETNCKFAKWLLEKAQSGRYDFDLYQMEADD